MKILISLLLFLFAAVLVFSQHSIQPGASKNDSPRVLYSLTIKSKAMNTNTKDPGPSAPGGGCCGGITGMGCC